MAVIQRLASRGSLKKIIDYVMNKEKTNEKIISGKDCLPECSVESMSATKNLYNKTDGLNYHHIMQSFKPGEVSPELAHEVGKELAENQFKGYEVLIATHIDKAHIHNHFVINSVSFEDGRKFVSNKETLRDIKKESDRICRERGLSVIEKPYARNVYSMAEYKLAEKGQSIWKEQLRSAIDEAKEHSGTIVEMKNYLEENFNIKMKFQNKNLSFLHPDKQKYCRGQKLGNAYDKDKIMGYFEKSPEEKKSEREAADRLKEANPAAAEKKKAAYEKWEKENPEEAAERKATYEKLEKVDIERTIPGQSKSSFGLSKVGFGIEGITNKIARDIEKEKIRVDKTKTRKDRAKEKYMAREKYMGRDRDRGRERER